MRLLFVAPRYAGAAAGVERHCRDLATRLAGRGHEVEVATSCAGNSVDVPDAYEPGTAVDEGVLVHRFDARSTRDGRRFVPLRKRVLDAPGAVARVVERDWMRLQGPDLPGLPEWLRARSTDVDTVIFFSFDRATSFDGLHAVTGLVPTVLHPLASASPVLGLGIFDHMFRTADGFAWNTDEEHRVVAGRVPVARPSIVVGMGADTDAPEVARHDIDAFRSRLGLGDTPFLLGFERADADDDTSGLIEMFTARRARRGADVTLVVLGPPTSSGRPAPGVVTTEVHSGARSVAAAGCLAVVQPSYDEDVLPQLLDAWTRRRPVLVDGGATALLRLVRDSGGGVPYAGFAEFEAAVDLLLGSSELAASLGGAGRRHVEQRYRWDDVLFRYERFLEDLNVRWRSSTSPGRLSTG